LATFHNVLRHRMLLERLLKLRDDKTALHDATPIAETPEHWLADNESRRSSMDSPITPLADVASRRASVASTITSLADTAPRRAGADAATTPSVDVAWAPCVAHGDVGRHVIHKHGAMRVLRSVLEQCVCCGPSCEAVFASSVRRDCPECCVSNPSRRSSPHRFGKSPAPNAVWSVMRGGASWVTARGKRALHAASLFVREGDTSPAD
jgi:hypothetical protein